MSISVNRVCLLGNVGKDPDIRQSADGKKVVNLSVATSETWKDKSGERQEKTEWHRVVIFNPGLAEIAERYVKKGTRIYVEGSLQTRKWTDNNGIEKYTTEIVLKPYSGNIILLSGGGNEKGEEEESEFSSEDYQNAKNGFNDSIPF